LKGKRHAGERPDGIVKTGAKKKKKIKKKCVEPPPEREGKKKRRGRKKNQREQGGGRGEEKRKIIQEKRKIINPQAWEGTLKGIQVLLCLVKGMGGRKSECGKGGES